MLDRYLSDSTEPYAKIYPEQRAVTGLFSYKLIDEGLDGLKHRKTYQKVNHRRTQTG